jgi:O-antigen/teichoic acid export membrane protein
MFFSQVDILICAKWLGKEVVGYYSVAMHLAALPHQKISSLVNPVAFPTFSRMQGDLGRVGVNVLLGIRVLSFIGFPLLWGISSIAPEIVEVILGSKWMSSAITLQLLALIIPLRMVGNFIQTAIQGIGRSDIVLRNAIWASVLAPIIFFIGAYWWGLLGLSIAWIFLSPVVFVDCVMRGMPALGLQVKQLVDTMMLPAVAALVMYGAVTATRYMGEMQEENMLRLFLLFAVGVLAYCVVSFSINRKATLEVIGIARTIATRNRP